MKAMDWRIFIPLVLVMGSLLLELRKGPRDLHRAPTGQTAYSRWTRIVGIGLASGCSFEILALLLRGKWTDPLLPLWLLPGTVGFSIWFHLSEVKKTRDELQGERTTN